MKKALILVIFVAAIGLAGPKIIGGGVNQKIDEFVTAINKTPGYRVKVINSETSWFSTLATVNIGIDPILFDDMAIDPQVSELFDNFSLDTNVTIQHGPFLSLNGFGIGLLAAKADVAETLLRDQLIYDEDKTLYSLAINLSLFGNVRYSDKVQGFTLKEMDSVSFSGWNGQGTMSSSHFYYEGGMDVFSAQLDSQQFEVAAVTLELDSQDSLINILTTPFYDSYIDFSIGLISVKDSATDIDIVSLKNFLISGTSDISRDGQLMDVDVSYGIEEMTSSDFSASDLLLKLQLNNLEKGFVTALQQAGENPSALEQLAILFDSSILEQLKASPEVNITELSGRINDSGFSAKVLAKLNGIEQIPDNLFDSGYWLSKLIIDSSLEMEETSALWLAKTIMVNQLKSDPDMLSVMSEADIESLAAQQAEGMVNALAAQGMIMINAKDNFEVTLGVKDSQVWLNGNPMPLPF